MIKSDHKNHKYQKYFLILISIILLIVLCAFFCLQHFTNFKNLSVVDRAQTICKDCNVIMVSLDTLSANHLPCYGYDRNTAPNLCSFAKNNIFFQNVYSNASWTLPSHISIFSGLYPFKHKVMSAFDKLDKNNTLLPELLKTNGYNILFFIPNEYAMPAYIYNRNKIGVFYNNNYSWDKSIEMFKQSVRENNKTFMFLHTYDVHSPYLIGDRKPIYSPVDSKIPVKQDEFEKFSPGFVDYFISEAKEGKLDTNPDWIENKDRAGELLLELENNYPDYSRSVYVLEKIMELKRNLLWSYLYVYNYLDKIDRQNNSDVETLKALYDNTINILDEEKIPLLTNIVEDPEFKDNTILIIFADHGEEFMEHGHLFHETVYNPNLRVPLIMYLPKLNNKIVSNNIQLVDIFPTLIKFLDIKTNINFDGINLFGNILGSTNSNRIIVTDGWKFESRSLILGDWKLLLSKQEENNYFPYELYNLKKDPGETNNILFENLDIKDYILKKFQESN